MQRSVREIDYEYFRLIGHTPGSFSSKFCSSGQGARAHTHKRALFENSNVLVAAKFIVEIRYLSPVRKLNLGPFRYSPT